MFEIGSVSFVLSGLSAPHGESLLKIMLIYVKVLYELLGYMLLNYT